MDRDPRIGERVEIRGWSKDWAYRRRGKVSDGPFWEVTLGNGDVYYAISDELLSREPVNESAREKA